MTVFVKSLFWDVRVVYVDPRVEFCKDLLRNGTMFQNKETNKTITLGIKTMYSHHTFKYDVCRVFLVYCTVFGMLSL